MDVPDGPCTHPEEAFRVVADSLAADYPEQRDKRWRSTYRVTSSQFHEIAQQHGTTGVRLKDYLDCVSSFSDQSGSTTVYARLETIAGLMHCSVSTVNRCRAGAVAMGYHAPGRQLRWLDDDHGLSPWSGGPSMIKLVMPDYMALRPSEEAAKRAERLEVRRRALQQKTLEDKQAREAKRARAVEELIKKAPERIARNVNSWTLGAREAFESARKKLEEANNTS